MKIQAILFDFVGVLLFPRPEQTHDALIDAVDTEIGSVVNDLQFKDAIQEKHHLDDATFEDVLKRVVDRYVPFQPLWELLPPLRETYKLGIINNGTWLTYPLFNARLHLEQYFDVFISSGHEGMRKPDQQIYQLGCKRMGVPVTACLFMDDCLENVIGAERVGMQAIHWPEAVTGFEALIQFLSRDGNPPPQSPEK